MLSTDSSARLSSELTTWLSPEEMLSSMFDVSITGLVFYRPVFDAAGTDEVVDFTFVQLNAAAQRMLGLPQQPTATLLEQFPNCRENGSFAFQQNVFRSGEPALYELNYRADGFDNYFRASARRVGPGLLISFTDSADHPRTLAEEALRESEARELEAREKAIRAEAEAQQQLNNLFLQAPACIACLKGPLHLFTLANPSFHQLFENRPLLGKPIREALANLQSESFFDLLDKVYLTGETVYGNEVLAYTDHSGSGRLDPAYFNFIYQAIRGATGTVTGVLIFAYDVTEQVKGRQQVEAQEQETNQLYEELAAANEELQAAYYEIQQSTTELLHAQQEMQLLNQELENHVADRTQKLQLAQAEAEQQRVRLVQFFMQAPAALCILDGPDLVFELVNPGYQQLFPGRSLAGNPILEALPEIADHDVYRTFQQVYETGTTHQESSMLIPFRRPEDGVLEDRYFNYIQQARYTTSGQIDGVLVFAFEVTEQVKARQASEASTQQLRLLTDALPVLIGYLDQEQKYQFANHAYKAWFNQDPEKLLGRQVREIVGEKAYAGVRSYIERALAGERLDFEAKMPYRENFVKHIHTSYVPDVQNGQVRGFYTLITDVTDQVEARLQVDRLNEQLVGINEELQTSNEELINSNKQLTAANIDLDNFIYTASHDLKAPITNIEGLLETLLTELPATSQVGEVAYILELMQGAVDRFKRTIEHLTDVSKLQKEYAQPTTQVQLSEVVEEVRLDLVPLLLDTGAQVEIDMDGCPPLAFSEKNLRSIVYNLLSNAIKYHHPGRLPQVRVSCREENQYLVLEVQDNGLGLDLSRTQQLFQMFQRFHTHVEGSGIGLYMVKKMVENAGGQIQVQSHLGEGTTFSVYFLR